MQKKKEKIQERVRALELIIVPEKKIIPRPGEDIKEQIRKKITSPGTVSEIKIKASDRPGEFFIFVRLRKRKSLKAFLSEVDSKVIDFHIVSNILKDLKYFSLEEILTLPFYKEKKIYFQKTNSSLKFQERQTAFVPFKGNKSIKVSFLLDLKDYREIKKECLKIGDKGIPISEYIRRLIKKGISL